MTNEECDRRLHHRLNSKRNVKQFFQNDQNRIEISGVRIEFSITDG
ncbi:MAG TPA: hypothetical protein VK203_20920 [Nostocaceae cyanobacterium]|nr:hypothetical protein [Nostocaceae cyanobacterium]